MSIPHDAKQEVDILWQKYLSKEPKTGELTSIFFLNEKKYLNELVWKEMRQRRDVEKVHLMEVLLFSKGPDWVSQEAFNMLLDYGLDDSDTNKIVDKFGTNHPISEEIEERFGLTKNHFLSKVSELL